VGIIALLGISAEMNVVMILFMDIGLKNHPQNPLAGIREGALNRLRPKVMTTLTTFTSLIPAMNILCPHINLGYLPCNLFCDLREEGMITLICLTLEDYIKGVKKNYEVLSYRKIEKVYSYTFLSELSPEYPMLSYNAMFMDGAISLEKSKKGKEIRGYGS